VPIYCGARGGSGKVKEEGDKVRGEERSELEDACDNAVNWRMATLHGRRKSHH
jgi:hypothetical protein